MHLDFLRSRSMLFLYFILLVFAPFTISAQDVPIDVSPSVVDSGQTVFVRTAGGATCFWDATDGTSGQVTADANGDILFGIANPPGTTISIFCRLNNQSSATVSITVRDDAQPDPVDPGQPDPGIAPPPPPPPPPPPGFICAASPDVAMHVEPDSNAPIFSFMQPAYVQFDVLDQVQNSSGLWYQVAPDGMWVRSDQVLRDDPSCDDQPLEQPYAIEHAPERITLVQERLEVLGCPGLTDTVLDNFTDSQILVFIYSPNACEYFDNSFNQMEQPPEPWISSQAQQDLFAECRQDALVVATFIDIMGGLESGTRADMRRLLDTVDPCEFARTLVTEQRLLGLDGSYRLSSALEPIIATCIPNYSTLRMRHTITTMRFVLDITMEDVIGGVDDPCVLVESLMSLGILTSEESDLFDTLLVCEDIGEASALELLTYAKSMGLDAAEILAEFEANEAYCDDLIAGFNTNPIDPDDLTAEETRHIGQIAGATEACMTDTEGELDTNAYIALVMMAWQHWDDLTLLQQIGLLTADDPCIAIENFILNGIAPPAPVVESGTILPPVNSSFVTEVLGGQELAETLADVPDYIIFIGSIPALGVFVSENGTIVDIHSVIEGSESRIPNSTLSIQ